MWKEVLFMLGFRETVRSGWLKKFLEGLARLIYEYRYHILIGLTIFVLLVVCAHVVQWRERRKKRQLEDQMKGKG
jgi:hypothetical protein